MINRECFPSIYKKDIRYYCDDKPYQVHINIHLDKLWQQNEGLCGPLLVVAKYNFVSNITVDFPAFTYSSVSFLST